MEHLRLLKYPGSKGIVLPELDRLFAKSGATILVDVFGGSGIVSLNLPASRTIYNDINGELVSLFRTLQEDPETIYRTLKEELSVLDTARRYSQFYSGYDQSQSGTRRNKTSGSDTNSAWETLIRYSKWFGGMGETYATSKEKSLLPYLARTISDFGRICERVRAWVIENMDFRDLFVKYDSVETFFYIDPPYSGKKWYDYSFSSRDFGDLSRIIGGINGIYVMNLDYGHRDMSRIFGRPTFLRGYRNQNLRESASRGEDRQVSFYTNIS